MNALNAPVQVIAIAGGKGGVGKTSIAVNLAMTMAMSGKETMLLDADLGLANVDVLLGLQPTHHLGHLLDGHCGIADVVLEAPHGLKIVPATSGVHRMAELSTAEHAGLIRAFCSYADPVDTLIVDTAAGISESVTMFCAASREVVIVVCDEPASLTDAYALVKVLSREYGVRRFRMVANRVATVQQGRDLCEKLTRVSDRFLEVGIEFAAAIPEDEFLQRAIRRQQAVVEAYPGSRSALAFKNLAQAADKWVSTTEIGGHLEFFTERRLRAGQPAPVLS
ncbi:MAG TPA: MinD/ParA family protein [Rhodanobacteraceae bacterium]|nr:MinD/ParA family protein [Rhodanobacteraceae bacterium]